MEKFDLENFPTSESAKKMLSYVTDGFYDKSYVGKWLFEVMGIEYDDARKMAEELPEQFFPETATWGLMYHEIKWGLPVRNSLPDEERRRLIYQKRDVRSPMTPSRMEKYLEDVTGFKVNVADIHDKGPYDYTPPHPNVFKVFFEGEGTLDAETAKKLLNSIKQSHTLYKMAEMVHFIFNTGEQEKICNPRMILGTAINFWGLHMLNGEGLLDGSISLGEIGRYNLIFGIKYNQGEFNIEEYMDVAGMKISVSIETEEEISAKNGYVFSAEAHNWKCLKLDGGAFLDGRVLLDVVRQELNPTTQFSTSAPVEEEVGKVTVREVRNLAYLNGAYKLNGSKLLNSIDRKEEL